MIKNGVKSHVVATPFIEIERENRLEPPSGDTVPPLRGSENVEISVSINGVATTWLL